MPTETKPESRATNPLFLYGLAGARLTLNSMGTSLRRRSISAPSFPRKRESTDQQRHPRESGDKFAIRNQVRIEAGGSLLPLREKVRMRVRRAQARLCGRSQTAKSTLVSPLWERARAPRNRGFAGGFPSSASPTLWIPAFAGMTGVENGNTGKNRRRRRDNRPSQSNINTP